MSSKSRPRKTQPDYAESLAILKRDPRMRALIWRHGSPQIIMRGTRARLPIFHTLLRSIIYQQLSGKAAATILGRFKKVYGNRFPRAQELIETDVGTLRETGISTSKIRYMKDVAEKFASGHITPQRLSRMPSDAIIERLVEIHGVGVWTAQMLLIFRLGRLNILPVGDLGIRKGFQRTYALNHLPTPAEMEHLARPWREHASIAAWYLWRAADGK